MIKVHKLNKVFNEKTKKEFYALKDINFEIEDFSCVLLKGISGSGKSTLLSILASLLKPTSGEIFIDKQNIAKLPDFHASSFRAEKIGFIFQAYNLFDTLSVKQNVALPLIPRNFTQKQIDEKVAFALNLANITHKKDELIYNLSGGEKQRCAIARALVNNPKFILCDEPTASLDTQNSLKFIEVLKELKKLKKTIIIATHDPIFDGFDIVDKTIHIKNGMIDE